MRWSRRALVLLVTSAATFGVVNGPRLLGGDGGAERADGTKAKPEAQPEESLFGPAPKVPERPSVESDEDLLAEVEATPGPKAKGRGLDSPGDIGPDYSTDTSSPPPPPDTGSTLAVRSAVSDTLATVGYGGASVDVGAGGRSVTVTVRRDQACNDAAATPDRLLARIKSAAPDAGTVRVTVAGTGQSLAAFRRSRCEAPSSDGGEGSGRVVYSRRGSGPVTTPSFSISGRRWTVTYRNRSDFFQAFVVKGGRIQPFVLSSTRPGTGTESFRGPGRFQLKINGAEGWSVTVRDGG